MMITVAGLARRLASSVETAVQRPCALPSLVVAVVSAIGIGGRARPLLRDLRRSDFSLRSWRTAALMLVLELASAAPAAATVITRTYDFSGNNLVPFFGSDPAPTDPVQGQITVTFDTAVDVFDVTSGIALNSLNIPLGSAIAFTYSSSVDTLEIGGAASGGTGFIQTGTNDFSVDISFASTVSPALSTLVYSTSGLSTIWTTSDGSVTVVPEPSTGLLLSTGLLALAIGRRKRA